MCYDEVHQITRHAGVGHHCRGEIDEAVTAPMHDAFDGVQWSWMGQHAVLHANHESVFKVLVRCVGNELHCVSDNECDTSLLVRASVHGLSTD
jgi:hypothetical protein